MTPFRVGFVAGVTPDKWATRWRERSDRSLELVPDDDALAGVRAGTLRMALVRLPVEREGLHVIALYVEQAVVVVPLDHPVAAYDEIALSELSDEYLHPLDQVSVREAVEAVAAGTGIVVVPRSVARLHQRKDVAARPVTDVEDSEVALVWRRDDDDPDLDTFVGVVRGRTVRSSRGAAATPPVLPSKRQPDKPTARKRATARGSARARVGKGRKPRR